MTDREVNVGQSGGWPLIKGWRYRFVGTVRGTPDDARTALIGAGFSPDTMVWSTDARLPADWPRERTVVPMSGETVIRGSGTWTKSTNFASVPGGVQVVMFQMWLHGDSQEQAQAAAVNSRLKLEANIMRSMGMGPAAYADDASRAVDQAIASAVPRSDLIIKVSGDASKLQSYAQVVNDPNQSQTLARASQYCVQLAAIMSNLPGTPSPQQTPVQPSQPSSDVLVGARSDGYHLTKGAVYRVYALVTGPGGAGDMVPVFETLGFGLPIFAWVAGQPYGTPPADFPSTASLPQPAAGQQAVRIQGVWNSYDTLLREIALADSQGGTRHVRVYAVWQHAKARTNPSGGVMPPGYPQASIAGGGGSMAPAVGFGVLLGALVMKKRSS